MDKNPQTISEEQLALFERYVMGQMAVEESASFEASLQADEALKTKFQEFRNMFHAIEEEGLRGSLDEFHGAFEGQNQKAPTRNKRRVFLVAASIAALVTFGLLQFLNSPSPGEKLFDTYFTPDPGLPTVMGSNDNYAFYEAMVDYKQGKYEVAIDKWEKLLISKPQNDTLNYFLGMAHLAKGEEQKAIGFLDESLSEIEGNFKNDAHHYLGLAHLKLGNIDLALEHLGQSNLNKSKLLLEELTK